ncbi:hypothetical protein NE237_004357 [Protea cynaroides]|uniref:Nucleolar protein 16 n=1 Tax=Protea cynaroides TaxID=273540 RepID=A0A9Q0KIH7_9MAGN|nr:hypothetical protein NE237_004357 [Protea cynaroides]
MGGSRRKHKKSRTKVQVGLLKKNPHLFKPTFNMPLKHQSLFGDNYCQCDGKDSVLYNYKSFGAISNPNLLDIRSHTSHIIESDSQQLPPLAEATSTLVTEFDAINSTSNLEEDDLKAALGKKQRDGKTAPLQPLIAIQRVHVRQLAKKFGDDY